MAKARKKDYLKELRQLYTALKDEQATLKDQYTDVTRYNAVNEAYELAGKLMRQAAQVLDYE